MTAVPVLVLLAYGFRVNHRDIPSPLIDRPAARFTVTSYSGEPVSLEAHLGRVVVVNFWASWCVPACYDEAPVLERNWRAYRARGVVVLGVTIQDTPEAARKFIDQFGLTFPNGLDASGKISISYGVYGVPETFFIDGHGRIRAKHVGAVTDAVFKHHVERLLAERP